MVTALLIGPIGTKLFNIQPNPKQMPMNNNLMSMMQNLLNGNM